MPTIFGLGASVPLPRNADDWLGLGSGIVRAVAAVRLDRDRHLLSAEMTGVFILWAAIFSISATLVVAPGSEPDADLVLTTLLWLVPVIMIIPGTFASLWGPKYLSPGLVGLLFMPEIVAGAVSATLLSGEPFGWREFTDVC